MNTEIKKVKCACCKKEVDSMFNQTYCPNCRKFTSDLRVKVSYYKRRFENANIKLYGCVNGNMRIKKNVKK